jgi:phosphoglycolate phosphatase
VELLIFDLDGTLIDSQLDLANSVNAAREHMGLPHIPVETIATYVGNGAPVLMRRAMGPDAPESEVRQSLEYFLAYYREHMLDNTTLYPGVREAVDRFKQEKVKMAVLTNKPVRFSQGIIDGLGLHEHFFRVYGGNSFEQKKPDPVGVHKLIEEADTRPGHTMMVGDSAVDVRTARNANIRACGVTYGFQPEGFETDPPDILVDNLGELAEIVFAERRMK